MQTALSFRHEHVITCCETNGGTFRDEADAARRERAWKRTAYDPDAYVLPCSTGRCPYPDDPTAKAIAAEEAAAVTAILNTL